MSAPSARWMQLAALLVFVLLAAAAWKWTGLREFADPERAAALMEPYRRSPWAPLIVLVVFVVAQLVMFPVLVLVFVCGLAFGPWWGAAYALFGALAGAMIPFFIGRKLGGARLERWGGAPVKKLRSVLERRGVVAVFLVRKIPAPYTLVNMACGASPVSLRDFVFGTVLGMGTGVLLITVLGGRLMDIVRDPQPAQILGAAALLLIPVVIALLLQRVLNRRMEGRS